MQALHLTWSDAKEGTGGAAPSVRVGAAVKREGKFVVDARSRRGRVVLKATQDECLEESTDDAEAK